MANSKKRHLIIFTNKSLPSEKISFINEIPATADVVTDFETVASRAETVLADAIIVIGDDEATSGIVKSLREDAKVDELPILAFKSLEEAVKIIPIFLKSKL